MNQKVALRLLERLGYSADVASNGLEAIEALERRRYDVVLMDVQMPELDGLDASRRICERWPDTRPRIIAMTANALPEDREACFAAGMDDYVAKPIRPDVLAEALKRVRAGVGGTAAARTAGGAPRRRRAREPAGARRRRLPRRGDRHVSRRRRRRCSRRFAAPSRRETPPRLRRAAHTLKSNGATLGATEFAELCRELEQQAKDGRLEEASGLVARIEEEHGSLERALEALRPAAAT